MIQCQLTDNEIKKAREFYLLNSKPYADRLSELYKYLTPKIIKSEREVIVFYEETEQIVELRKYLEELSKKINDDLNNGKFS